MCVGYLQIAGGNGRMLYMRGFVKLTITVGTIVFWHLYGIVL